MPRLADLYGGIAVSVVLPFVGFGLFLQLLFHAFLEPGLYVLHGLFALLILCVLLTEFPLIRVRHLFPSIRIHSWHRIGNPTC